MTDKEQQWEERAKKFDEICPNLAAAMRSKNLQEQCAAVDQMAFENGTMYGWLAAVDLDSFNYFPKRIPYSRFDEAFEEGLFIHADEAGAQKECDALNAM